MPRTKAPQAPEPEDTDNEAGGTVGPLHEYRRRIFVALAVAVGLLIYLGQPGNPLGAPRARIAHRVLAVQPLNDHQVSVSLWWHNDGSATADVSCTLQVAAFDGAGNAMGWGTTTAGPSHSLLSGESNYDSVTVTVTNNQAYGVSAPGNVRISNC